MAQASSLERQLLTVQVDGQSFALPTDLVHEVATFPRLSRVPHAPDVLLGLANLRGAVVPILSMARLLGRGDGPCKRVVFVDAGETVGLAVEAVSQIVSADAMASAQRVDIAALVATSMGVGVARRSRASVAAVVETRIDESERINLVTFSIGNQEFALPLMAVKEVLRLPSDIARLPHSDEVVIGSTLVRGQLLPLLSMHALLALPSGTTSDRSRVLVILIGSHRVGLVVDATREILRVPEEDIDPIPHVLSRGGAEARIQAICRVADENRLVSILAADQIVHEDITARMLQGRTRDRDDMAEAKSAEASEQFLLFRIGDDEFALPIASVQEVVLLPSTLTPLPRAPAFVLGVMNLRGNVLPVIDQVQRFNGKAATGKKRRVVVVRIGDLQAGFIVDAVSEILRVPIGSLRNAPDLGGEDTKTFERVANLPEQNKIILIVSPRELLDRAEQDLLATLAKTDAIQRP